MTSRGNWPGGHDGRAAHDGRATVAGTLTLIRAGYGVALLCAPGALIRLTALAAAGAWAAALT